LFRKNRKLCGGIHVKVLRMLLEVCLHHKQTCRWAWAPCIRARAQPPNRPKSSIGSAQSIGGRDGHGAGAMGRSIKSCGSWSRPPVPPCAQGSGLLEPCLNPSWQHDTPNRNAQVNALHFRNPPLR
jgi:hypothetical protein